MPRSSHPSPPSRRLACERCGAVFACGDGGREGGCWCADETFRLPLPAAGSGDCLCPDCLRRAAADHAADTNRP